MQHRRLLALLGAAATLVAAAPAGAVPPAGQTLLLDQLSGAPLPFDGAGRATLTTQPLSADGRWLVFSSSADSLLAGDDDSGVHVYRLDRSTGAVQQVDVGAGGEQLGVALRAADAQVSADGSRVAFMLTRPVGGLTAVPEGVYVKDLASGALELASRATGAEGAPAVVGTFAFSGDGRHLAFTATASLHTDRGDGGNDDVYLRDLDVAVTVRLDHHADGSAIGTVATGKAPAIDFDGDLVAFVADAGPGPDGRPDQVDDAYISIAAGPPALYASGVGAVALAGDGGSLAFLEAAAPG